MTNANVIAKETGLSKTYVANLIDKAFYKDMGEYIVGTDSDGVYMMDITYQPGYHLCPIPYGDFIKMLEDRLRRKE